MTALAESMGLDETGIGTDRDTFTSIENLTGSAFADELGGNGGANRLKGLGGNDLLMGRGGADTLDGGAGADTMVGGSGNDVYFVDNAGDLTIEEAGGGIDEVHAYVDWTLAANVETLYLRSGAGLSGTGNGLANTMIGNSGANTLEGLGGNDHLEGRGGNDRLAGGAGADTLTGNAGNDIFAFGLGDGHDTITDFDVLGDDILEISGYQAYSEVQQVGSDAVVVFSQSDTLTLKGMLAADLSPDDFAFV
jgi:Ca2+-binding RTX toxin-like protein